MAEYKVSVTTGGMQHAGTLDNIFIVLFGSEGHSERARLDNSGIDFKSGTASQILSWSLHICLGLSWHFTFIDFFCAQTRTYSVKSVSSLGKLLLLKVEKDSFLHLLDDSWYCSKVEVMTPEGEEIAFPCYRWISSGEEIQLRGGKGRLTIRTIWSIKWRVLTFIHLLALKVFEEEHPLLIDHRNKELTLKKSLYQ